MVPLTYHVRSLLARPATTMAAAGGVGLVAFVLAAVLMLSGGIRRTLSDGAAADNVIFLRAGTPVEVQSVLSESDASLIASLEGLAADNARKPVAAAELVTIVTLPKRDTGVGNAAIRAATDQSFAVRDRVHIVEGRRFAQGTDEVIVGKSIADRFAHMRPGERIHVRTGVELLVVGVFEAGGSVSESEIWGDIETLRILLHRRGLYSSVTARLSSIAAFDTVKARLLADPRLRVDVMRESTYFESQSEQLATFVSALGIMIASLFSFAAMLGAAITMYSQVVRRSREIGILRALGFQQGAILISFVAESAILCLAGGLAGTLLASALVFGRFSTTNVSSFSEVVFRFDFSWKTMLVSVTFATVMGVIGGLLPAVRAARIPPAQGMRG